MSALDGVVGNASSWAALAVAAYLCIGLLATGLARHAGVVGRCADAALRLYPRIARTAMRLAVAGTVGVGATVLGSTPAAQAAEGAHRPQPPRPPVVAPAAPPTEPLDWPVAPVAPIGLNPPVRDLAAGPATATRPRPEVLVRPGDCLWTLAARSLGRSASTEATAAAWPRWWAANRTVIGDDPDLLRAGLRLRVPRHLERSGS